MIELITAQIWSSPRSKFSDGNLLIWSQSIIDRKNWLKIGTNFSDVVVLNLFKLHPRVPRPFPGQNRFTQNNEHLPNFFIFLCRKSIDMGSCYVMWCLIVFERFWSSSKKIFINPNRKSKVLEHCFSTKKLSGARDN